MIGVVFSILCRLGSGGGGGGGGGRQEDRAGIIYDFNDVFQYIAYRLYCIKGMY